MNMTLTFVAPVEGEPRFLQVNGELVNSPADLIHSQGLPDNTGTMGLLTDRAFFIITMAAVAYHVRVDTVLNALLDTGLYP